MVLKRIISCVCLLLMILVVTGCASSKNEVSPMRGGGGPAYSNANGLYGGVQAERMQQTVHTTSDDVMFEADAPASGRVLARGDSAGSNTTGSGGALTDAQKVEQQRAGADKSQPNPDRKLIRNAWMTIEVDDEDDYPEHIKTFHKVAESLGGYVQSESSSTLTMMVPTERIDEALKIVAREGKVTYRNISVVDATSQYVDMQIRIENLRKMRVRLTELVNQSTSVQEVLQVERELSRVTSELERIEGQMRLLSKQTSYATINLTLEERVKPGPLGWIFYGIGKGVKWLFIRN